MALKEVVIVSAARTAIGKFMGSLKDVSARDLAITAAKGAIERSGVPADKIDEICMGQLYTGMQGSPAGPPSEHAGWFARLQQRRIGQPELHVRHARAGDRLPQHHAGPDRDRPGGRCGSMTNAPTCAQGPHGLPDGAGQHRRQHDP